MRRKPRHQRFMRFRDRSLRSCLVLVMPHYPRTTASNDSISCTPSGVFLGSTRYFLRLVHLSAWSHLGFHPSRCLSQGRSNLTYDAPLSPTSMVFGLRRLFSPNVVLQASVDTWKIKTDVTLKQSAVSPSLYEHQILLSLRRGR
jgi:hypothetical protein